MLVEIRHRYKEAFKTRSQAHRLHGLHHEAVFAANTSRSPRIQVSSLPSEQPAIERFHLLCQLCQLECRICFRRSINTVEESGDDCAKRKRLNSTDSINSSSSLRLPQTFEKHVRCQARHLYSRLRRRSRRRKGGCSRPITTIGADSEDNRRKQQTVLTRGDSYSSSFPATCRFEHVVWREYFTLMVLVIAMQRAQAKVPSETPECVRVESSTRFDGFWETVEPGWTLEPLYSSCIFTWTTALTPIDLFFFLQAHVAVLGAAGGIGQPLSLLMKLNPHVSQLSLYDVVNTPGVAADLSHINSRARPVSSNNRNIFSTFRSLNSICVPCLTIRSRASRGLSSSRRPSLASTSSSSPLVFPASPA